MPSAMSNVRVALAALLLSISPLPSQRGARPAAPRPCVADAAALGMMSDEVLAPEVIDVALDKLMAKLATPAEDLATMRTRLSAALRETEAELGRLAAAIASGDAPDTLLAGIREREARRRHLVAELHAMEAGPAALSMADAVRTEAQRLLGDWRGLLEKHVGVSRQGLRKLLDRERFVFYVEGTGDARYYELGVTPTLDKFFAAVPSLKKAVASPTGFEPVFWP